MRQPQRQVSREQLDGGATPLDGAVLATASDDMTALLWDQEREKEKVMTGRMTATTADTNTYNVTAKRWKHGWELHIDGVGVTQSRTLDTAEQMVRDYIETLTDKDVSGTKSSSRLWAEVAQSSASAWTTKMAQAAQSWWAYRQADTARLD
jgi:hypothetical protein